MKVNDHDIKVMVQRTGEMHTKLAVIQEKCENIEDHLKVQNDRLSKHTSSIEALKIGHTELKTRMWVLLLLGSSGGGFIGYLLGSVLLPIVGG